jgi:hypothetical protein
MAQHDRPLTDLTSPFDDLPVRERVHQALLTLREPTVVETVSNRANCSVDAARTHLNFFAELGPATKHSGRPQRFERNEEYFDWKYVTHLADTNTDEELQQTIADLKRRRNALYEQYDVDGPTELDLLYLEDHPQLDPEAVWDDLSTWVNIDDEIRLHRRARRRLRDRGEATA